MTRFYRPLFAGVLLLCIAMPASAQVQFGVKAGMNIATLGGDDANGLDSRTGLVVGGLVNYRLTDMLSIQPEILYTQKGTKASETDPDFGTFEFTLKTDYLEIPVLLKLDVPVGAPELRPTLHVGPTFAFEVGCEVDFSGMGISGSVDCDAGDEFDEDGFADRRKFDMGLGLGGGLDVAFGGGTLMIEARHTLGLQSLDKSDNGADLKHRVWSITFGYRFSR
jgi:hypothetical protein